MKKGIQLHYFFEQSFFLRKLGCSLKKKKKKVFTSIYIRFPYFSLFPSQNPAVWKRSSIGIVLWREVTANNLHTAIIVRKAVSTTTFAYFRGAQFGNRWFREHLDFWAKIAEWEIDSRWRPFFFFREHLDVVGKIAESEIDFRWRPFFRGCEKIWLCQIGSWWKKFEEHCSIPRS